MIVYTAEGQIHQHVHNSLHYVFGDCDFLFNPNPYLMQF